MERKFGQPGTYPFKPAEVFENLRKDVEAAVKAGG